MQESSLHPQGFVATFPDLSFQVVLDPQGIFFGFQQRLAFLGLHLVPGFLDQFMGAFLRRMQLRRPNQAHDYVR